MRIRLHRAAAAASAAILACAAVAACPIAASADTTSTVGWVRLAQFSPTTTSADVYLSPTGGSSAQSTQAVLTHATYGTLSPYQPVAPGGYTVAMRTAGAAATTDPFAGTQITVAAGQSYTVAAIGVASVIKLQVLDDELGTPAGQAGVRVIEASRRSPAASVSVGVNTLAANLRAPAASPYQPVNPGAGALIVTTAAVTQTISATFAANSAYSVVILDGAQAQDAARVLVVTDAAGISAMPKGGVSTGFGGTASTEGSGSAAHAQSYTAPLMELLLVFSILGSTVFMQLRRQRRRRAVRLSRAIPMDTAERAEFE